MDPQLDLQQLQGALTLVQVRPEDHAALLEARMISAHGALHAIQGSRFVDRVQLRPSGDGHWTVETFTAHSFAPITRQFSFGDVSFGGDDDGDAPFDDDDGDDARDAIRVIPPTEAPVGVRWNDRHVQLTRPWRGPVLSSGNEEAILPWDAPDAWEPEDLALANLLLDDLQTALRATIAEAHRIVATRRAKALETKQRLRDAFLAASTATPAAPTTGSSPATPRFSTRTPAPGDITATPRG